MYNSSPNRTGQSPIFSPNENIIDLDTSEDVNVRKMEQFKPH